MLVLATEHQAELNRLWAQYVSHPDFLLWNVDLTYNPQAEIRNSDFRKDEWVSVVDGRVVGYLCALIDKSTRSVADISAANFEKHPRFSIDFLLFLKNLRRRYRCIRWACVAGHPNEKTYAAIIKRYGGREVGVFKKKIRLHDGHLYDERWYELEK